MAYEYVPWPAWRYGPNGERAIFQRAEDVPAGWEDTPAKFASPQVAPPDAEPTDAQASPRPRGRPRKVT